MLNALIMGGLFVVVIFLFALGLRGDEWITKHFDLGPDDEELTR